MRAQAFRALSPTCCYVSFQVLAASVLCAGLGARNTEDACWQTLLNDPSPAAIQEAVQNWQKQFGPVDFGEKEMLRCMAYLHPQPKSKFTSFSDEKLAEKVQLESGLWIGRIFRGPFYEFMANRKPSRYYLNQGRPEASLLMYEGNLEHYAITVIENYNVILITIGATNGSPMPGFAAREIATILTNWFNVKYQSADEAARDFSLSGAPSLGQVFTNKKHPEVWRIRDWRDYIVGFQSSDGLCLMLFKAEGPSATRGLAYDYNWLNKWMYRADGYTLLDPPKNQRANDPYRVGRRVGEK